MSNLIAVGPSAELLEGEVRAAVLANGTRVALYNLLGSFYATDDTCTHEHASLSDEGVVDGDQIICGWHLCGFDIRSGAASASPCSEPLMTYPVKEIDGVLYVEC